MKDKELEDLIKELEKDIDSYCGDYGTLEGRLENTLYKILIIIKRISGSEEDESPYCEVCGHCGEIECCGIRDFIEYHIKGKTNCKNEEDIISELIDLCDYKDEVFKENEKLKSIIKEVREYIEENYPTSTINYQDDKYKLLQILDKGSDEK